ncbi:cytochrome c oxidase subunit II [Psychrobacillus vulpis]|uniref:Cytochrome c oxidase subunit 2 n=1 Tax=Psychrobacillus vulpis TaxID=2325572 RepID=A0A544TKA1_9BACI|nr:cytochrome c oxidase subunit II [Psychrobacillus vulpis]TQR17853.1 cytochrome c oxidase subunit II [Psychrobacillus vulpis]
MMKGLKKWRLFSLLAALTIFLSGCGEEYLSTLTPAGQVGRDQYNLLLLSSAIMALVILVVVIIYVLALVKFRRSKVGENVIPKQVEGSHTLEIIWTVIPIILLLILAVPTVAYTYKHADVAGMSEVNEEGNKTAVTVNVTAKLYWWEFEYPDLGIVTAQELVVPTNEKVYFNLKAADVKHSFWIPTAGGKMDTNVENVNQFYLEFDKESAGLKDGVFYGKCAELCGPSHALMDFKVKTLDRKDFDAWVESAKSTEHVAQGDLATQGEEIFNTSCIACHATSAAGTAGSMGPNLGTFGDRNRVAGFMDHDKENLKAWINDPQSYKPGNVMPQPEAINNGDKFSEEQLDALAEYLMGLSVEK